MDKKFLAFAACIVLTVMIVAPIMPEALATGGPVMNVLQYRFFNNNNALFTALLSPDVSGGVDVMDSVLTRAQYTSILNNPAITVAPCPQAGEYELAFNNNWTNTAHTTGRSAMNYTDFRNAMNCLVDKNGVIAGPILYGFATRDDTQIPQPLMQGYVNPQVSYPNYPWEYNETKALEILYNGFWYSHTVYTTFASLLTTFTNGSLAGRVGTTSSLIYPGVDPYGQWGGTDTYNNPRVGTVIDTLKGYVRSGDARLNLGDYFCAELTKIGCPFTETYCATLSVLKPFVMLNNNPYDFATLGYSMASPPNWWYTELRPVGIYSDGPNCYLVDDANMTYWATKAYTAPTQTEFMTDINNVQDILVMESELVSVYSPASYCAYKTGMLGMVYEYGYGFSGQNQLIAWLTMNARKTNTINYTGSTPPESNIIYYGTHNPPDKANPIFANTVYDFQVMDNIWTYPMATNPYDTMIPGSQLTGVANGGDLPWMAYCWKVEYIPDQTDPTNASLPQWTNVTYWFRNDITWQDGFAFDVNDFKYTIQMNALYGDSWAHAAFMWAVNPDTYAPLFTRWPGQSCSVLIRNPSWLNLYLLNCEIVPQHLYENIVPDNITAAEEGISTDGLHGVWPGQAALPSNFLPGGVVWGITYANVADPTTGKPDYTLVGTGPWKYRPGSTTATLLTSAGGNITLDAYSGFWMKPVPGVTNFRARWLYQDGVEYNGTLPCGITYKNDLGPLILFLNGFGKTGTPPSAVPISAIPGAPGAWNPAIDVWAPAGVVGVSDLVILSLHYGWYWGNYSYNAPYPIGELLNPP